MAHLSDGPDYLRLDVRAGRVQLELGQVAQNINYESRLGLHRVRNWQNHLVKLSRRQDQGTRDLRAQQEQRLPIRAEDHPTNMIRELYGLLDGLRLASDVAEELDVRLAYDVFEEDCQSVLVEAQLYDLPRPRENVVDWSFLAA